MMNAINTFGTMSTSHNLNWLRTSIEKTSTEVAEVWDANLRNSVTDKLYNIGLGQTTGPYTVDDVPGSSPLGDLRIQVENGPNIILELKWQTSKTMPTNWFGIVDEHLFDGGFTSFLDDNRDEYWNYQLVSKEWSRLLETEALFRYIENDDITLNYLIHKGEALTNETFDVKYVVHGTQAGITIQDVESLALDLTLGAQETVFGSLPRSSTGALIYRDEAGNDVAVFGLEQYKGKPSTSKKGSTNIGQEVGNLNAQNFAFRMYVAQSLMNRTSFGVT